MAKNIVREFGEPKSFGNGVYYFDSTHDEFGASLASFIKKHPKLEIASMVGHGVGSNGCDIGYFIVFKAKK